VKPPDRFEKVKRQSRQPRHNGELVDGEATTMEDSSKKKQQVARTGDKNQRWLWEVGGWRLVVMMWKMRKKQRMKSWRGRF
jgi:hypothetical protein